MDQKIGTTLEHFRDALREAPVDPRKVIEHLRTVLEHLARKSGGMDDDCLDVNKFIFHSVMCDDCAAGALAELPEWLRSLIEDMGSILDDTCTAPEIARMFESTPEQLLLRLNKHAPGRTDK